MAFTLTAKINLLPPSNMKKIAADIQKQLSGIKTNINVAVSPEVQRQIRSTDTQMKQLSKNTNATKSYVEALGHSAAQSVRRFAGFTIFASVFYTLTTAIKSSLNEAIAFQRELVKIRQVSGTSLKDLKLLTDEVSKLSSTFGVSSTKLLNSAQILAQAGFSIQDVNTAMSTLTKIDLAPTFEGMTDATEGMIAIMGQFGTTAGDFEKQFSAINTVSAKFAVESSDIITAIRRTGGAFAAAGGQLNDLIALFTSVRSTTRESAETIATGFRTIFTRLQRTRTIDFLDRLGINLRDDLTKQFIGPYEAIRRLSAALNSIPSTDVRFAQITEELGGFRQIGKVIPLVKQFNIAEQARIVAQRSENSLTEDAAKAQDAFAIRITRVKEEFQALIRTVSENDVFKQLLTATLTFSSALIKLADSLQLVLPLLTTLGAIKLGSLSYGFGKEFLPGVGAGNVKGTLTGGLSVLALTSLMTTFGKMDDASQELISSIHTMSGTFLTLIVASKSLRDILAGNPKEQLAPLQSQRTGLKSTLADLEAKRLVKTQSTIEQSQAILGFRRDIQSDTKTNRADRRALGSTQRAITRVDNLISVEQGKQAFAKVALDVAKATGNIAGAQRASNELSISKNIESLLTRAKTKFSTDETNLRTSINTTGERLRFSNEKVATTKESLRVEEGNLRIIAAETKLRNSELAAIDKQIRYINNTERAFAALNVSASVLSGVLITLGQSVEKEATARVRGGFAPGVQGIASGRSLSSAGFGAGAGATTGIGVGAGIGTIAGLPGTVVGGAIGVALGSAIGAIKGFNDGLEDGKNLLESFNNEREFRGLKSLIDNVQSSKTSPFDRVGEFRLGLNSLQSSLEKSSLVNKESASGRIDNSIVGIETFLVEITRAKKSFSELEQTVGRDVLEKFAGFAGIPFEQVKKKFEEQIKSQTQLINANNILGKAQENQLRRVQLFNSLSAAVQDSITGLRDFSSVLEKTEIQDLSSIFSRNESITDRGLVSRAVGQVSSSFGTRGSDIGSDFIKTSQVLSRLPDIIINATAKPFDASREFIDDFRDSLLKQFPDIPDILRNALEANVLKFRGAEGKDEKIFQAIQETPTDFLKQLGEGVLAAEAEFFEQNSRLLTQQLNGLAALYEKRRALEEKLISGLVSVTNLRESQATFNAEARGGNLSLKSALDFDRERLDTLLGGRKFGNVAEIGEAATVSQNNIVDINQRLQKENGSRDELLAALEKEKDTLATLTRGLEFYADVTARNTALQKELETIQKRQRAKFDFARNFTFGDSDSRRNLATGALGGGLLARTGDIERIPGSMRGNVLSFLEGFDDTKLSFLGGKSGREVIRGTIEKTLIDSGLTADEAKEVALNKTTPGEEKIISSINNNFNNAILSQKSLNELIQNTTNKLLTDIKENTVGFKALLERNLLSVEREQKIGQATSLGGEVKLLDKQREAFVNIQNIIGSDKNRFNNVRAALPQLVSANRGREELLSRGSRLRDINKEFSASDKNVNERVVLDRLLKISGSESVNKTQKLGQDRFETIRSNFRNQFGGESSAEIFNSEFFEQFDTDNGTIREFLDIFLGRIKDLNQQLSINLEANKDENEKLRRQTGLKSLDELFTIASKAENLTNLFKNIPDDIKWDGLIGLESQSDKTSQSMQKLNREVETLTTAISEIDTARGSIPIGRNAGGIIPGTGSRDTVPANLTPGEFVIRKDAAKSIGYDNLKEMNRVGYAKGGYVSIKDRQDNRGYIPPKERKAALDSERRSRMSPRRIAELDRRKANIEKRREAGPPTPGLALGGEKAREYFNNETASAVSRVKVNQAKAVEDRAKRLEDIKKQIEQNKADRLEKIKSVNSQVADARKFFDSEKERVLEKFRPTTPKVLPHSRFGSTPVKTETIEEVKSVETIVEGVRPHSRFGSIPKETNSENKVRPNITPVETLKPPRGFENVPIQNNIQDRSRILDNIRAQIEESEKVPPQRPVDKVAKPSPIRSIPKTAPINPPVKQEQTPPKTLATPQSRLGNTPVKNFAQNRAKILDNIRSQIEQSEKESSQPKQISPKAGVTNGTLTNPSINITENVIKERRKVLNDIRRQIEQSEQIPNQPGQISSTKELKPVKTSPIQNSRLTNIPNQTINPGKNRRQILDDVRTQIEQSEQSQNQSKSTSVNKEFNQVETKTIKNSRSTNVQNKIINPIENRRRILDNVRTQIESSEQDLKQPKQTSLLDKELKTPEEVSVFLKDFADKNKLPFTAKIGNLADNEKKFVGLNRVGKDQLDFDFSKPVKGVVAFHEFGHNLDDKLGQALNRRGKESVSGNSFNNILEEGKKALLENKLDLSKQSGLDRNSLLEKPQEMLSALFAHPDYNQRIVGIMSEGLNQKKPDINTQVEPTKSIDLFGSVEKPKTLPLDNEKVYKSKLPGNKLYKTGKSYFYVNSTGDAFPLSSPVDDKANPGFEKFSGSSFNFIKPKKNSYAIVSPDAFYTEENEPEPYKFVNKPSTIKPSPVVEKKAEQPKMPGIMGPIHRGVHNLTQTGKGIDIVPDALENYFRNRRKFALGGPVPGSGNSDTVPAMLTPGEFVIKKDSAKAIGYNQLDKINKFGKRYARGGKVGGKSYFTSVNTTMDNGGEEVYGETPKISPQAIESFSKFGENINRLSTALDNFPRMVEMNVRHTIEVIHNGAQVFQSLNSDFIKLVESTVSRELNKLMKNKFPDIGNN